MTILGRFVSATATTFTDPQSASSSSPRHPSGRYLHTFSDMLLWEHSSMVWGSSLKVWMIAPIKDVGSEECASVPSIYFCSWDAVDRHFESCDDRIGVANSSNKQSPREFLDI